MRLQLQPQQLASFTHTTPRHRGPGQRQNEFHWISLASGKPFALKPGTAREFTTLKKLRNHLAHFDPPCFAATLAEVRDWLNLVHTVADVLRDIRLHLAQPLSESTVNLLLLPRVEFVDQPLFDRIHPAQEQTIGYRVGPTEEARNRAYR